MHLLFAAPHRDLIACYQTILSEKYGEVTTAFDGTAVLSLIHNTNPAAKNEPHSKETAEELRTQSCNEAITREEKLKPFDLAIIDQNLPRIPLNRIIAELKEKEIPVLLLIDTSLEEAGLTQSGPNGILPYPFFSQELIGLIDTVLSKTR